MTYLEKVAAVVSTLTGSPLFLPAEDLFHANYRIEDCTFPVVMHLPNGLGNVTWKTQVIQNNMIALWFAEKCELDVTYATKQAIWDRMFLLGSEFLIKAGLSGYFFEPTEVTHEPTSDKTDVNICGEVFYFKLKERSGLNVCDLDTPFPPVVISAACARLSLVVTFSKPMDSENTYSNYAIWVNNDSWAINTIGFTSPTELRFTFLNPIAAGDTVQIALTAGLLAVDGSVFNGAVINVTNNVT